MSRWFSRSQKNNETPSRVTTASVPQEELVDETVEAGLFPARVATRNGAKLFRFAIKVAIVTVLAVVALSFFGLIDPVRQLLLPVHIGGKGTLIVSADYTRTQVSLDGKVVGQTPFTGESIDAGRHTLMFQAAENPGNFFAAQSIEVQVNAGNTTIVKANLGPDPELFSYTSITSANRQAGDALLVVKALQHDVQIRVDGTIVGKAPFITEEIGVGSHQVLIEKEGYKPVLLDITIAADKVVTVESELYQYQINLDR